MFLVVVFALLCTFVVFGALQTTFVGTHVGDGSGLTNLNFRSVQVSDLSITNSATASAPFTSTSPSQNSPAYNEFVTAAYVGSILNNGQMMYGTSNSISVGFTNYDGNSNTLAQIFSPTNSITYTYSRSFSNFVTGTYWASTITTNLFTSVSGPFISSLYVNLSGGTVQHPSQFMMSVDIYATDRKSTRLNSSHVSESRMPSSA